MTKIQESSQSGGEPPEDPAQHDQGQHEPDKPRKRPHPALDFPARPDQDGASGKIDKVVFGVTAAIAVAFLVWGFVSTESLASASGEGLSWTMKYLGWFFVLVSSAFVVFVLWLALGKYGSIPLGRDTDVPEFRTVSWIAMMFSAGMGIGLMFYGVNEPLTFFADRGEGGLAIPGTPGTPGGAEGSLSPNQAAELAERAMAQTLFHWTLHPWAIYAVVGLAIAYSVFRKGRLQLVSSAFESLFGRRRTNGPVGRAIDMLAIFATLFGSAASLGLGALQISKGLQIVSGLGEVGNAVLVGIIAVLTACFIVSAVSGVSRGIQYLSNINMVLALILAVFVFVAGPTLFILNILPTTLTEYAGSMPEMAGLTNSQSEYAATWLSYYTIFYWAWWISWTPFVGMFLARISRGRTIRQFVTGVLLVPSLVTLFWFAIFGGSAIKLQTDFFQEREGGADVYGDGSVEAQLFNLLEQYPLATVTSILVMLLVGIFFVSGADAASIVMGSLSSKGAVEPRRPPVIFWGVATGGVAAVMLLIGGATALDGLKTITILAAVPFALVMVLLAVALVRDLSRDPLVVRTNYAREAVHDAVVAGVTQHGDDFALAVQETPNGDADPDLPEEVVGPDSGGRRVGRERPEED